MKWYKDGHVAERRHVQVIDYAIRTVYEWYIDKASSTEQEVIDWLSPRFPEAAAMLEAERDSRIAEQQAREAREAEAQRKNDERLQIIQDKESEELFLPSLQEARCEHCGKPAQYYTFNPGCSICGGIDCGDSAHTELWCEECAVSVGGFNITK